jgi:purine nucleoside permease
VAASFSTAVEFGETTIATSLCAGSAVGRRATAKNINIILLRPAERPADAWVRLLLLKYEIFIVGLVTKEPSRDRVWKTASLVAKTGWCKPGCRRG